MQRAALLDAARSLLSEGGTDALTFPALAERTGLARSSVYEYFRSRAAVVEELHAVFSQLSLANVVALEELLHVGGEGGDRLSLMDTLEDTAADNPVEVAEDRELRRFLARAINTLPEREKIVVTLYYYEGLTLAEIGRVLGVTESRICQMHTKAVLQLRAKLAEQTA